MAKAHINSLLNNLQKNSEAINELHLLSGRLETLSESEKGVDILITNFSTLTKKDLITFKNILKNKQKETTEKIEKCRNK